MDQVLEHDRQAEAHEDKAENIQIQLDSIIYLDDVDVFERTQAKLEKLEEERDTRKKWNKENKGKTPFYLPNITAKIRKEKKRLEAITVAFIN